jgi:hypothetical protein
MMNLNLIVRPRSFQRIRRTLSVIALALSFVFALAAFGVPVNTSWTYQGQLRRSGAAYNGICNFQFSLWDAASAGTQQRSTQSINGVSVVNGLFTVTLNFAQTAPNGEVLDFSGDATWLATSVQCSGDGAGFTQLDPRQPITATPYALTLRPGALIESSSGVDSLLDVVNHAYGYGISGSGGFAGVFGSANQPDGRGVFGTAYGQGPNSVGVFGYNESGAAISGRSGGAGPAILGENTSTGYAGQFLGRVDVQAPNAVSAISCSGLSYGVVSEGNIGVWGKTQNSSGVGIYGSATDADSAGVFGANSSGTAIWGKSTGAGSAIYGQATSSGYAGRFTGSVLVEGNLVVGGSVFKSSGNFRIDHPLDPANKFLSHSFVESPDMKNIYEGNVVTDATGSATVMLPAYFEALNRDFHYQLTVLGQFAQAIVSRKIAGNSFEIRTDKPGVEVSWLVTGIRQDAYAQANPIVVEEAKPAEEQGLYLFPAGFGAGEEKQIGYPSRPTAPRAQEPPATGPGDQASK